jgi:hypothetical protein
MSQIPEYIEYIERVKAARAAATEHDHQEDVLEARTQYAAKPVASWVNGTPFETGDIKRVLDQGQRDSAVSQQAVCIVEDINWDWIGAMGVAWGVEPQFFAEHGVNPQGDNDWEALFPKSHRLGAEQHPSKCFHVDGAFEHHHLTRDSIEALKDGLRRSTHRRRCWISLDPSYSPSSSTRFSYCRVNANLCIFTHHLSYQ